MSLFSWLLVKLVVVKTHAVIEEQFNGRDNQYLTVLIDILFYLCGNFLE